MMSYAETTVLQPIIAWLVSVSVLFVGYLAALEWREFRHHRRLDARRHGSGLDRI